MLFDLNNDLVNARSRIGVAGTINDISGTPIANAGNGTCNSQWGRAAFAAAGQTITVNNQHVLPTSTVLSTIETSDTTLKSMVITPALGGFTCVSNVAATGITKFSFIIIN